MWLRIYEEAILFIVHLTFVIAKELFPMPSYYRRTFWQ
jgi:hypothetical protein